MFIARHHYFYVPCTLNIEDFLLFYWQYYFVIAVRSFNYKCAGFYVLIVVMIYHRQYQHVISVRGIVTISPRALFIHLGLLFLPLHYYQEVIHPWFLDLGVDWLNSDSDKVDQISSIIRFISKINVTSNRWVIKSGGLLRHRNTFITTLKLI